VKAPRAPKQSETQLKKRELKRLIKEEKQQSSATLAPPQCTWHTPAITNFIVNGGDAKPLFLVVREERPQPGKQ